MTVFWWIAGSLFLLLFGAAAISFAVFVIDGDDRWRDRALALWRWALVTLLASFNIALFKHIIGTLLRG